MILSSLVFENDELKILDQTLLPQKIEYKTITNIDQAIEAIKSLRIRGAPAIGVMAALSIYVEQKRLVENRQIQSLEEFYNELNINLKKISQSRPTAVNLFYAIERIRGEVLSIAWNDLTEALKELKKVALSIFEEDKELCEKIGFWGSQLVFDGAKILTHCNTGSLATAGKGTALGVIYTAVEQNKKIFVYNTETRPLLQGSRLTSFELQYAKIPNMLITDNMVASLFANKEIDMVLVGADRIARNGDTANKIGTLGIAILSQYFSVPFYVVAPSTSIDTSIPDGSHIPIEFRRPDEVRNFRDCISSPPDVEVYNPAFDITPSHLITGIITEMGIFRYPYQF
ncbi:MAG: S-methyl-5-thioribose-1-phosphate isomerase [Leptospiraceae bacterium]|nr:S-methyl-5-thioribose-1-phosphate isomerase [Leptospiraceae bacterium]MDW7975495.1 S-methyl-5-thioribose-1-phosphate isomerase [Leptospiraceae bacterium]